jgi:hypothetical protein
MADSLLKSDPSNLHQTDCTIDTTTASSVTTASAPDAGSSTTTAAALTVTTDQADYGSTATDVALADTLEFSVAAINAGADGRVGTADDFLAYDLGGTTAPWIVSDGGPGDLDGAANGTIVMNVGSAASACEQAFSRELLQPLTRDTALAAVPWLRSSAKTRH